MWIRSLATNPKGVGRECREHVPPAVQVPASMLCWPCSAVMLLTGNLERNKMLVFFVCLFLFNKKSSIIPE